MMMNEEAIKLLERQKIALCHDCMHPQTANWCEDHCLYPEAFGMAIEALKAQEKAEKVSNNSPELNKENGELIRRQAAIDAHCELCGDRGKCNCDICPDIEVFQLLPPAQQAAGQADDREERWFDDERRSN